MTKIKFKEPFKKILRTPTAFVLILVAVISLIGVILTNASNQELVNIPINATLTAETKLTELASSFSHTSTPFITETISVTPHLTSTPTHTPTITPFHDWKEVMEYSLDYSPCHPSYATIIIGSENQLGPSQLTLEMLEDSLNNETPENLAIVQLDTNDINFSFRVRSVVQSGDWIELENWANFIVKPLPIEVPEFLHAYYTASGCGGGNNKLFDSSIVKLETGTNEYHISTSYDDYEFLSLQPGELDYYDFIFSCKSPGVYQVTLEQNFVFQDISNQIKTEFPLIYCPKSMLIWEVDYFSIEETDGKYHVAQNGIFGAWYYSWNGSEYYRP